MLMPAKLVKKSRQKTIGISVAEKQWERLIAGYERLIQWLKSIAPQLKLGATIANVAIAYREQFEPKLLFN